MPKMMIDGVWRGDVADADAPRIEASAFRGRVEDAPGAPFPAERGRYHLYVSYACPFAHRTLVARALAGLGEAVGVGVLHPRWNTADGWMFGHAPWASPDRAAGFTHLHQAYTAARPGYTGRVTVPVLWDARRRTIVNNDSRDIVLMLATAFGRLGNGIDLYPERLRAAIDDLDGRLSDDLARGVYAVGGARDQAAYDAAHDALFACLDDLDARLSDGRPFLHGARPTVSDILAFTPLVRFDAVYNPLFRASWKRLVDYPRLSAWAARVHDLPGVADTVRLDHVLAHYHDGDWGVATRVGIVPRLPARGFRDRPAPTPQAHEGCAA